jgi:tetratricopeptide (TPR) repeat protein
MADSPETLLRLAERLLKAGRVEEAIEPLQQAARLVPDAPAILHTLGRACLRARRIPEAITWLERAIASQPDFAPSRLSLAEAHLALGRLLTEAGRFDEAADSLERSIALSPSQGAAYHALVSSRRLTEGDRPLVARIRSRLEAPDLAERPRMALHFAAGKALDDLGDYAGAIQHFDAANAIRARLCPFDPAVFEQRVDRLIARFTRELFAAHASMGGDDETPVLVLGMPRSGTTLVERIVSSHPKVAGGGELSFWNEQGLKWADAPMAKLAESADALRRDYLRLLRTIGPDASRVTDKMPFNFLWIGLVHLLLPRARIIHCRRNPVDTCLSIYATHFSSDWAAASDRGGLVSYYRQYLRLMDHWRAVLPPDRLLEVDYEEATAAPEPAARRLVAFCGLEWDPACLQPERNRDVVRTASKWQARQPIYRTSVERWRNYEPWIGELRGLLP